MFVEVPPDFDTLSSKMWIKMASFIGIFFIFILISPDFMGK